MSTSDGSGRRRSKRLEGKGADDAPMIVGSNAGNTMPCGACVIHRAFRMYLAENGALEQTEFAPLDVKALDLANQKAAEQGGWIWLAGHISDASFEFAYGPEALRDAKRKEKQGTKESLDDEADPLVQYIEKNRILPHTFHGMPCGDLNSCVGAMKQQQQQQRQ